MPASKGALNAGRPKTSLPEADWVYIEIGIQHDASVQLICEYLHINRENLERLVRKRYNVSLEIYWNKLRAKGRIELLNAGFKMIEAGKYPNVMIYYLANWLNYINTDQFKKTPSKDVNTQGISERILKALDRLKGQKNETKVLVQTQINKELPPATRIRIQHKPAVQELPVPVEPKAVYSDDGGLLGEDLLTPNVNTDSCIYRSIIKDNKDNNILNNNINNTSSNMFLDITECKDNINTDTSNTKTDNNINQVNNTDNVNLNTSTNTNPDISVDKSIDSKGIDTSKNNANNSQCCNNATPCCKNATDTGFVKDVPLNA